MNNKPVLAVLGVIVVLAIIFGAVALGGKKDTSTNTSTGNMNMASSSGTNSNSKTVETDTVAIQNFVFSPATIKVKVGTKVTWTNKDSAAHTVTGDNSDGPASGTLAQGASYSFTFSKAGTFTYACAIHPSMKGTVVVTSEP